jgi:N-acetylmuramoyl-L-alanine amidase
MDMKYNNFKVLFIIVVFLTAGCATAPIRENIPTYSLNGTTYYALAPLCELKGISLKYDTFSRTASLIKGGHNIDLMVSDNLVLVDRRAVLLNHPVDVHEGVVVVPVKFKEQILDSLFRPVKSTAFRRTSPVSSVIRRVVIDPGHGGRDPGAISKRGLKEKDVNLDIARMLANQLKEAGVEVVMTRDSDKFVSLDSRVNIANNSRADIFISLHANSARATSAHGLEVFYISPRVSDIARASYAAKNTYLNLDSSCFASHSQNLKAILWDMIYTYNRAESIGLCQSIMNRLAGNNLSVRAAGVKDANFMVLRGVRMPAILVEVGFLSNPSEERLLRESYYREKITRSIMEGLCNYAAKAKMTEVSRR